MKITVLGKGPLAEQAVRLAEAAGYELVPEGGDYILPATEDDAILKKLDGDNVLFDRDAWALCSSRLAADEFLKEHGFPIPVYFPGGSEPYFVKPDRGSFGLGAGEIDDYCEVGGAVNAGYVAQEALTGDTWSAVVAGVPGAYAAFPPAKLTFDDRYRRQAADCGASAPQDGALKDTALRIAEAIGLRGVLETEAIFHNGAWTVVDLNARIPMLTSDALLAQGVNLLEELIRRTK